MSDVRKQTPWEIQKSVIFACFVRELNARFGRFQLGYFWAICEPLAYILGSAALRGRFTDAPQAGLPAMIFFASGILPFLLFRNMIRSSATAVENNLSLFNYQRVKPIDILLARHLLDFLIMATTAILIAVAFSLGGLTATFNNALLLMLSLACLLAFAAGAGLILSLLAPLWPDSSRIIPVVMRILFFTSGAFFPANAIPAQIRDVALLNPLLHLAELIRGSAFTEYTSHEGSWSYLIAWSLGLVLLGLMIYRKLHIRIISSGAIKFR